MKEKCLDYFNSNACKYVDAGLKWYKTRDDDNVPIISATVSLIVSSVSVGFILQFAKLNDTLSTGTFSDVAIRSNRLLSGSL